MYLKNKIFSIFVLTLSLTDIAAQSSIKILEQGRKTSIRGLSVVSNEIIWVSGSNGSVGKSVDGGNSWQWITVTGYEKSDFRDIEAFDENTALMMGITQPAVILKTTDGGTSWRKVFEDTAKAAFFDAMSFYNPKEGFVIGDPVSGTNFYGLRTNNYGESWEEIKQFYQLDTLQNGEAFFASSGSNIKHIDKDKIVAVTGGTYSRLIASFIKPTQIPIIQGLAPTGANSIDIYKNKAAIVGGDFERDTLRMANCVLIHFSRKKLRIQSPQTSPHGYRSCVIYLDENNLITCGTSGVDISSNGGMNWQLISNESFNVVQKAKRGNAVFFAGTNGKIGRL